MVSTDKPDPSELPTSPSCCFGCMDDFDLPSLLSWTGITDDAPSDDPNPQATSRNGRSRPRQKGHRAQADQVNGKERSRTWSRKSEDRPPPVISLSRSSFSTTSSSDGSTLSDGPDVVSTDTHSGRKLLHGKKNPRKGQGLGRLVGKGLRKKCKSCDHDLSRHLPCHDQNDQSSESSNNYAGRHELLINALFEDAKHRQEIIVGEGSHKAPTTPSSSERPDPCATTPPRTSQDTGHDLDAKPTTPEQHQTSAAMSVVSRSSRNTTHSKRSINSNGSDLLSPSAHRFKRTLSPSVRKGPHSVLPVLQSRAATSKQEGVALDSSRETEESSFHASLTTSSNGPCASGPGNNAVSFLHSKCQLQKDSGKGADPGSRVTSEGKEAAMAKLVEKMDVLAEVERDGSFVNAELTRVKAKDVGSIRVNASLTYAETRSMLAVKVGYLSLRYGILVHWNTATGLAELIVLRKKCPDSFMKVKHHNSKKVWRKRMRKKSIVADSAKGGAPTLVALTSAEESDGSCSSFGLEAVNSYPY